MELKKDWAAIRAHFRNTYKTNFHYAIASVGADGIPSVTPIGSLFLNDDGTGFYFERYPKTIAAHAKSNINVCILAVNSGKWFWLKALRKGRFLHSPALKLYGQLGAKRAATEKEKARLDRRMRMTKGLKGHQILWGPDMRMVRPIVFTAVSEMKLGKMF